eukprot:131158-Chlamydomonas_euryale.AAC.2
MAPGKLPPATHMCCLLRQELCMKLGRVPPPPAPPKPACLPLLLARPLRNACNRLAKGGRKACKYSSAGVLVPL